MIHFIDCGGNKGQSVQYILDTFKDVERIDTFEPLKQNYDEIVSKYGDNEKVFCHQAAIWKKDTIQKFYTQDWGAMSGSSLIEGKSSTNKNKFVEIECIDLVEWIKQNVTNPNIYLKIDIEGAEYEVINHLMNDGIDDIISKWFIEWHPQAKVPTITREYIDKTIKRFEDKHENNNWETNWVEYLK